MDRQIGRPGHAERADAQCERRPLAPFAFGSLTRADRALVGPRENAAPAFTPSFAKAVQETTFSQSHWRLCGIGDVGRR